jgi:hypothetical protein
MVQGVARGIKVRDGCAIRCGVPKGVGLALVSKAGLVAQTRSPEAEELTSWGASVGREYMLCA